jgi:hypothetical protein
VVGSSLGGLARKPTFWPVWNAPSKPTRYGSESLGAATFEVSVRRRILRWGAATLVAVGLKIVWAEQGVGPPCRHCGCRPLGVVYTRRVRGRPHRPMPGVPELRQMLHDMGTADRRLRLKP